MNILYSTHCPKCSILETKLKNKNIPYQIETNTDIMISMGIKTVPMLMVDNKLMSFGEAVKWVNSQGN